MIDREALEARLARVLRRYLAPELASRAAAEAVREPEAPPLPAPTPLEVERVLRIAEAKGMIVTRPKRGRR